MRNIIAPHILRKTAQRLFYLNAILWLLIALASLARIPTSSALPPLLAGIIALLMIGNAAAMLAAGIGLGKRRRLFNYFALLVLLVNIILTFTDQFGLLDFITLIIDLVLLVLVIMGMVVKDTSKNSPG